jgi:hypothetical protein
MAKDKGNGNAQETVTETQETETKKARKPKFNPPTPEVLSEAGEFGTFHFDARKVKGGGEKPARDIKVATNRKQFLALFNGDEKAAFFYGSLIAAALNEKWEAKNSPEKVAEKNAKKVDKLIEKLPKNVLEALLAKLSASTSVSA